MSNAPANFIVHLNSLLPIDSLSLRFIHTNDLYQRLIKKKTCNDNNNNNNTLIVLNSHKEMGGVVAQYINQSNKNNPTFFTCTLYLYFLESTAPAYFAACYPLQKSLIQSAIVLSD